MASTPPFGSSLLRLDVQHVENALLTADGVPSACSKPKQSLPFQPPSLWIDTQNWVRDLQIDASGHRSRAAVIVSGFAVAAATAIGLSLFSPAGLATAAELKEVDESSILSDLVTGSNQVTGLGHDQKATNGAYPDLDPSITIDLESGRSLSIAIPIPREQEWIIVSNGRIAPFVETQTTREVSSFRCPPWTPSELEMFLPDFNGRPKPFPRKGFSWTASLTMEEIFSDAIIQLADGREDVQIESMPVDSKENMQMESMPVGSKEDMQMEFIKENPSSMKANADESKEDGQPKVLGMERFSCFSM